MKTINARMMRVAAQSVKTRNIAVRSARRQTKEMSPELRAIAVIQAAVDFF
jgi:hypothetical protein